MNKPLQAVRGMNDILPDETGQWLALLGQIRQVLSAYGYQRVLLPIVESTTLFKRSVGEVTDIVEKEMYTFTDHNGDSLTLRPEGTAGVVRAAIEHGALHNQTQKWWYFGPMFRHERPQKGRYRQFYQLGIEAFGFEGPRCDAELLIMMTRLWKALGIQDSVTLELNSIGQAPERAKYRAALIEYFSAHEANLDEDAKRRLHTNPLRILDTKNPNMQACVAEAPDIHEYLSPESQENFAMLRQLLDSQGIAYTVNPRLVRGLDYYTDTVFEWTTTALGAQGTICAGGRYDGLVEQIGGSPTPGIGLAMGIERLLLLLEAVGNQAILAQQPSADFYLIVLGDGVFDYALSVAEQLRDAYPNQTTLVNLTTGGMKSQFKKADKSGAAFAIIMGEDEMNQAAVALKPLRGQGEQVVISRDELVDAIAKQGGSADE